VCNSTFGKKYQAMAHDELVRECVLKSRAFVALFVTALICVIGGMTGMAIIC
jgi:hypothetical protein